MEVRKNSSGGSTKVMARTYCNVNKLQACILEIVESNNKLVMNEYQEELRKCSFVKQYFEVLNDTNYYTRFDQNVTTILSDGSNVSVNLSPSLRLTLHLASE